MDLCIYVFCHSFSCSQQQKILQSENSSHEIPTKKNFGPTKYPWEKFRTHKITTKAWQDNGTRLTRPEIARDLGNIAHSFLTNVSFLVVKNLIFFLCRLLIGREKRVKYKLFFFKYFFISSIACCWVREPQKWVLYKKCPHRMCPLHKVDLETIFLELLGKMSSRKLLTATQDRSCLSPFWDDHRDFREISFMDTMYAPENTPYLDIFHAVLFNRNYLILEKSQKKQSMIFLWFSIIFY